MSPGRKRSQHESLRRKAAAEKQKLQEIDRLLSRLEARLADSAPGDRSRGKGKAGAKGGGGAAKGGGAERRGFPRKPADLVIRYRWPGRHTPLIGRMRDISRGGMRFAASRRLELGTALQASLHTPSGPGPSAGGDLYLEVVYCRKSGDLWEIGARFSPSPNEKFRASERRNSRRYQVSLAMTYRISGGTESPHKGRAKDISRRGLRFTCRHRLKPGSLAAVVVTGGQDVIEGMGTRIRVSALVRVARCRKVGKHYEVGAEFVG